MQTPSRNNRHLRFRQIISRVLAAVFILSILPVSAPAYANDAASDSATALPSLKPSGPSLSSNEATYAAPAESVGVADKIEPAAKKSDSDAKRVKELCDQRTETAKIYSLSDGDYEAAVSSSPLHYQDDTGTYIDIVNDVVPSAETTQSFGALTTLSTKEKRKFPAFGDEGSATLEGKGWKISMGYEGAAIGVPTAAGDSVYYPNIAKGIDLEYRSLWWGVKETLVLTEKTNQNTFDFRLNFEGLRLSRDLATSTYQLIDPKTGSVILDIGALNVTDSNFNDKTGEFSTCPDAYWEVTRSGEGWATVRATINKDWIKDPVRAWPVRIDPEVIVSGGPTQSYGSLGINTFTTSAWPASSNYNSYPSELRVGYYADSSVNCGYNRSFAGFTLPNLSGMRIDYAHLTVQQYWRAYHTLNTDTYVASINRAPATTDTWNNMPAVTQWQIATFTTTTDVQLVDFNVAAYVQAQANANQAVYGFMFYQSETGNQNTTHWRKYYSSRSGVYSPLLTLKYAPNIKVVTGLSASTTPSEGWFKEVEGKANLNDRNGQGRGNVTLNWNADPNAAGYMIYAFDGLNYNVVGRTVGKSATSWTSAGGGIYPTDSEIASLTSASKNPYITASTPSDNSYISGSATALSYPDDIVATAKGAGVVVFDGRDMYVKKWGTYPGPDQWVQFKYAGTTPAGVPAYSKGKKIKAPPAVQTTSISGFVAEGVLYDGVVTRLSGGTADLSGFVLSSIMDKSVPVTLTLSKPPLSRGGGELTAPDPNAGLFCADDTHIYSVGGVSGTSSIKVRVYDTHGTFQKDLTYTLEGQSAYGCFDGFATDGANFYFYEWSGTNRMTKASIASGKVVNQWHVSTQNANRTVSVAYNKASNLFVMGSLDTNAAIYMYRGVGVDLADCPKKLYQKVINNPQGTYYNSTNYWFRVATYSTNELMLAASASCVTPTLENRTIRVSDAAQRSYEPVATIANENIRGCLSTLDTRLDTTDLTVASPGPAAALSRSYASDLAYSSTWLPAGWMFSFEENIAANTPGALYTAPDGRSYQFTKAAGGNFVSPNGLVADLIYDAGGLLSPATYTLTLKDKTVKTFEGASGKLKEVKDRQGRKTSYDIQAASADITAENGQSITLSKSGSTITATYSTDAGTRRFIYTTSSSSLKVVAYPDSPLSLERLYSMNGKRLTSVQAAGDSVTVTYGATSLSAEHSAPTTPAQCQTITYSSTANTAVKRATIERGSTTSQGNYAAGYEKNVFLINAAQQVIWASTSTDAATEADYQGVNLRYNAENQVIGTTAPTWPQITAGDIKFPSKAASPLTPGQPQLIPPPASEFFTYDGRGNLVNTTNKAGGYAEYFYNASDDLIKAIDTSRAVTWLAYDDLGRLTTTEKLLSVSGQKSRTEYSYDSKSELIEVRSAINKNADGTYQFARVQYADFASCGAPQKITYKDVALSSSTAVKDLIATGVYDAFGNLVSQTTPLNTTSKASYDIAGKQITATDAKGVITHTAYDSASRATETYKTASALSGKYEWAKVTYDVSGLDILTQELAPDGSELTSQTKTFDALGREVAADSSVEKGKEEAAFDESGNVTDSTPETAQTSDWLETTTYDCLNRPVFTNNTKLSIQGDWHAYDDYSKESYCLHYGYIYKTTRDASGNIIKVEKLGSYDLLSKPVATTTTTYSYNNQPTTVTEEVVGQPKVEYVYTYDLAGRQTSVQLTGTGQGASTTTYNALGWVLDESDFDGTKTSYTYNERGDVVKKDQDGLITTAVYDSTGAITKTTADDGTVVDFSYDGIGRLTSEKHSNATATVKNLSYTYDNKGRVATQTDSVSNWTRAFAYERCGAGDTAYLKTTITDTFADGTISKQSAEGEYFTQGSITSATGTALTTTVTRDEIKRVTDYTVGSAAYTRSYNAAGLLARDSALSTGDTTYTYGEDGKLQATNYDRLGQSAAYTYSDDRSELKSAKIGSAAADIYSYDISKNLSSISGGPGAAQFTYGAQGGLTTRKVGDNTPLDVSTPTIIEDDNALLKYSAGWGAVSGNSYSSGSVHRAIKPNATLMFAYEGTKLSIFGTDTGLPMDLFTVTVDGKSRMLALGNGFPSNYYQQLLFTVNLAQGVHTVVIQSSAQYPLEIDYLTINGRLLPVSGSTATYSYDSLGRRISGEGGATYMWSGQRLASATLANASGSMFSEDYFIEAEDNTVIKKGYCSTIKDGKYSGGQAVSVFGSNWGLSFTVDGSAITFIGALDNMFDSCEIWVDGIYTETLDLYDDNWDFKPKVLGTVIFSQSGVHIVDIRNNSGSMIDFDRIDVTTSSCSEPEPGSKTINYVYDGQGQRISKQVGNVKTSYVYDNLSLLSLTQKSSSSTQSLTYLYGSGSTPVGACYRSSPAAAPLYFEIVSDAHGDVRELRDTSGGVFARIDYDAYGNIRSEQVFSTALINRNMAAAIKALQPLRYAGYVWDSETGLYYCSQRYYDPSTAAFISKDPIKSGGEKSAYGYCAGDPVNGVDPSGLIFMGTSQPLSYYKAVEKYYAKLRPLFVRSYAQTAANNSGIGLSDTHTAHKFSSPANSYGMYQCLVCHMWYYGNGAYARVTPQQLIEMGYQNVTGASAAQLNQTLLDNNIQSANEIAHFLAQCAKESDWGTRLTESDYGDPTYFSRQPYGSTYRGAGYIQVTGIANYKALASAMGDSKIVSLGADYVAANYAWSATGWWWAENNMNNLIAGGASVMDVTKKVRGSTESWEERQGYYDTIYGILR